MSISNYAELKILEHTTGKTSWTMPTTVYVKLHLGDPGEAATSNAAVEDTRKLLRGLLLLRVRLRLRQLWSGLVFLLRKHIRIGLCGMI
jgi:hypothetical protein